MSRVAPRTFLWRGGVAAAIGALMIAGSALGHGMVPAYTPVDRLIANMGKYTAEHPNDADGYYRLGRVHMLALETKIEFVLAFDRAEPAEPAEGSWAKRDWDKPKDATPATAEQLKTHLTEAIVNLSKAIGLKPKEPRYHLTLACALEAGASMMGDVEVWPLCPVAGVLEPASDAEKQVVKTERERFERLAKDPAAVDSVIARMSAGPDNQRVRDIIVSLAYEHRNQAEFKEAVAKIRRADWERQIEEQYFIAMTLALPKDRQHTEKPIWGGLEDWVSYEAGKDFIRVVEARATRADDAPRLKTARDAIKHFDNLPPPNAITPMVISLDGRPLVELTTARTTGFDLEGSGLAQRWSWVGPDAGILVWDPARTGRITSGRQLFGSVSWWVFFENGYQALNALDDNRDGELAGEELEGIAAWFDRNGNGVSDAGEVRPLYELGIAGLSTVATGMEGASPVNPLGMRMTDGRVLPTYDWVATRADERRGRWIGPLDAGIGLAAAAGTMPLWGWGRRRRM